MKYVVGLIIIIGLVVGVYTYINKRKVVPVINDPYALWCDGEYAYFSPGETNCFSINRNGEKLGTSTDILGIHFFGTVSSTTKLSLISVIIDDINIVSSVDSVSIKENGQFTVHSIIGDLLFPEVEYATTSLRNLQSFLYDKKDKKFEYIDVRHGSSVFYTVASTTHVRTTQ